MQFKVDDSKVQDDVSLLTRHKLVKKYDKIIEALKEEPYCPQIPEKHRGKIEGKKVNGKKLYHVDINISHRVFYTISPGVVTIEKIEYKGIVDILQAWGHDFR